MNDWLKSLLSKKKEEDPKPAPALDILGANAHLTRRPGESAEDHFARMEAWYAGEAARGGASVPAKSKKTTRLAEQAVDLSAHFHEERTPTPEDEPFPPDKPGEPPALESIDRGLTKIVVPAPDSEPEFVECGEREASIDGDYDLYSFEPGPGGFTAPVDPLITRMGGKSQLVDYLLPRFPKCHTYVEVFGGTLQVLLRKSWMDKVEIINEIDNDIVHLYQYTRHAPRRLCEYVNELPMSEALILGMRKGVGEGMYSGVQRAAATYLSIKMSFNGMISDSRYKSSPYTRLNTKMELKHLLAIQERLKRVDIRSRDFRSVIKLANKPVAGGVFFYLDPPYWMTAGYVSHKKKLDFGWQEHKDLADLCFAIHKVGNKFIQTNSAHEDLRQLYFRYKNPDGSCAFYIEEVDVYYSVAGAAENRKKEKEFLISNFPLHSARGQGKLF